MKRAAIYARVSTHNGQNPAMQVSEIRAYCERRGWEVVGEFVDAGISGAKERRPALDRLLSLCRRRSVDAVVVYRYDRFARSLRQLVNALEEFRALGIDFVSLYEGVDTSTPNGRLVFGIFGSIAEFERELIRDRVRSGLALAKAKGKRLGRPRLAIDAARIAQMRQQGASWATIGKALGLGEGTVRRAAQPPAKNLVTGLAHKSSRCVVWLPSYRESRLIRRYPVQVRQRITAEYPVTRAQSRDRLLICCERGHFSVCSRLCSQMEHNREAHGRVAPSLALSLRV